MAPTGTKPTASPPSAAPISEPADMAETIRLAPSLVSIAPKRVAPQSAGHDANRYDDAGRASRLNIGAEDEHHRRTEQLALGVLLRQPAARGLRSSTS
jgi:hypothetical protein